MTNGKRKCREKNLFNVALPTEKPPQTTPWVFYILILYKNKQNLSIL